MAKSKQELIDALRAEIIIYKMDPQNYSSDDIKVIGERAQRLGVDFQPAFSLSRGLGRMVWDFGDGVLMGALPDDMRPEVFTAGEQAMGQIGDAASWVAPFGVFSKGLKLGSKVAEGLAKGGKSMLAKKLRIQAGKSVRASRKAGIDNPDHVVPSWMTNMPENITKGSEVAGKFAKTALGKKVIENATNFGAANLYHDAVDDIAEDGLIGGTIGDALGGATFGAALGGVGALGSIPMLKGYGEKASTIARAALALGVTPDEEDEQLSGMLANLMSVYMK